jgi:hypothetical protein
MSTGASADAQGSAGPATPADLVVTIEATVELPISIVEPDSAAIAAPAIVVETIAPPPPDAPLPTSIEDVIEQAIRNADDDIDSALIEALRSTQQ